MQVILPFVTFLLSFIFLSLRENCWRRSWLSVAVAWGVLLTAITEFLSHFSLITFPWILGVWAITCLFIALWVAPVCYRFKLWAVGQRTIYRLITAVKSDSFLGFSLLSLALLLLLTALVALQAPPNNYDSMTYHMPRVMHWIQNQSVAHYPTNNPRQIDSPPWSGFAIMQFQVLSNGDRFANLVQWFSMVGCLIGVSLIAKELRTGLTGQVLASVVCATIPMGVLQSVTTQNDYVVSFWLVCLAYNVLLISQGKITPRISLEFGGSLGLALLTKGTAYIYAFPFVVVWAFCLAKYLRLSGWLPALLGCLPAIALNTSHWWRNYQVFQDLLGLTGNITKNKLLTLAGIISNLTRNIALHLPTAYKPINTALENLTLFLHKRVLHLDVDDPRTTFAGTKFQLPVFGNNWPIYLSEDISGNPLHLALILFSSLFYFVTPRVRNSQRNIYILSLLTTVVLFNLLLSWQPWGTRLQLPFFVLASPFVGSVVSEVLPSIQLNYALAFILTLGALPYIFFSSIRPVTSSSIFVTSPSIFDRPRINSYFNARTDLMDQYFQAVDTALAEDCHDVGLSYVNGNSLEYPLWKISNERSIDSQVIFRSVTIGEATNESMVFDQKDFIPCAIFAIEREKLDDRITLKKPRAGESNTYIKVLDRDQVQVYLKE